jgi:hypothetical protein
VILRRAGSTITQPLLNLQSQTSGSVDGDSFILYGTQSANWSAGVDQADSNKFRIEPGLTLGGADGLTITTGGNLGIGTSSPVEKLDVGGNCRISSGSSFYWGDATSQIVADNGGAMRFLTGTAAERARITSGGNFIVGGTSSSGRFSVFGTAVSSIELAIDTNASSARIQSYSSSPLFLNPLGNEVRVGGETDQGAYNLQCNGTGVWGAGAYVNGSDARLKDNIQPLDSGLDVVNAMRPVTFQYKQNYSKDQSVQPGFIAQELQEAMAGKAYLDGVVQEGTNHLNVAYQNIIPILVKAIQEQQVMINELMAKVTALESK